jgi:hypothetical protein
MPSLKIRFILSNSLANSGDANPVFWLSSQIAIMSKISPCHHATMSIKRDPEPS